MSEFRKRLSGERRRVRIGSGSGSSKTIRLNQSLSERFRASKHARAIKRATYLSTLPKNPFLRTMYRLHPKRLAEYWFSRQGAIMALKVIGVGIVVVFLLTIGVFAYFRKDLPNIKDISGDNLGGSITYYDRTGKTVLWQDYNAVKRIPVASDQISPYMKDATVAIEDKNFYHEGAFNLGSIIRAGISDVLHHGESLQGASTITEQLVKLNEEWTGQRTITVKVKELILAVELSREYSKDDILTGYLNIAPYGGVEYGAQAAAEDYFHTSAADLTLAQAAMLAAIPESPGVFSPYDSPQFNPAITADYFDEQGLLARKNYDLTLMAQQGYITQAQAKAAKAVNVLAEVQPLKNKYAGIQSPYFVLAAKQELENKYGAATVERGGWKVTTTLNLQLQSDAEQDVTNNLPNVEDDGGDEEAVVMEDVPTGQIMAEVGGVNFSNSSYGQINYAQINIPPGSSFKPYDYATLINDSTDVGAGSVLYDVQQQLPGYPCTNKVEPLEGGNCLWDYDFKYPGPETIRYALAGSRNVPAAKAMLSVVPNAQCEASNLAGCVPSINKVISTADAMMDAPNAYQCYSNVQLTDPDQCYTSSAFGDGAYLHLDEHVNGDATLARLGKAIPNTYILKITDSSGNTIYQWTPPKPTQVVRTDAAYIVDNILSDPRATYLPGSCTATNCTLLSEHGYKFQRYNGWDIAVKTGTTNDNYDGLMTAWTTQFAVDSWVGYHTRQIALTAGQMEYLTEPLTRNLIEQGLSSLNEPAINWVQPSDIKALPAYVQRTHIDFGDEEPGPTDELFPAWYTGSTATSSGTETLDKVSGGVATSCTPTLARETVGGANANTFSADLFYPIGQNRGTTTITTPDDVHNCNDSPPSVTITQGATCEDATHCDFTVTVTQGTHPLSGGSYTASPAGTISLIANGQTLATMKIPSGAASPYTVTFTDVAITNGETMQAQVVDSVLYSGTNTITVDDTNATPASISPTPTGPTT
ncbi:MAG: transglycosylase domain-containing protein [Candidatus Saccharimonadales bacterium]